jgi:hypothetical protein
MHGPFRRLGGVAIIGALLMGTGCGATAMRPRSVGPGEAESAPVNPRQAPDVEEKPPATYDEPDELDRGEPPPEELAKRESLKSEYGL